MKKIFNEKKTPGAEEQYSDNSITEGGWRVARKGIMDW